MPEFWHHIDPTLHPIDVVVLPFTAPSHVYTTKYDKIKNGKL